MSTIMSAASLAPQIVSDANAGTLWPTGADADERLFALWRRFRAAEAAARAADRESEAATDRLPAWAKCGRMFTDLHGREYGDLAYCPPIELKSKKTAGVWNYHGPDVRAVRPCDDYIEQYYEYYCRDFGAAKADRWRRWILARRDEALSRREAAECKLNIPALEQAADLAWEEKDRIEEEIVAFAPATPNLVGALLLIEARYRYAGIKEDGSAELAPRLLGVIRPLLTGLIAEEVAQLAVK